MNKLNPVEQKFILHWGEMGTKWGINRTVAQIHALLYISPKPLNAEEISDTLDVARSNVSNSLKELQGWRIVKLVHVMGDKRDHFEALPDVWETFRIVLDERKKREIDPTLEMLRECIAKAGEDSKPANTRSSGFVTSPGFLKRPTNGTSRSEAGRRAVDKICEARRQNPKTAGHRQMIQFL